MVVFICAFFHACATLLAEDYNVKSVEALQSQIKAAMKAEGNASWEQIIECYPQTIKISKDARLKGVTAVLAKWDVLLKEFDEVNQVNTIAIPEECIADHNSSMAKELSGYPELIAQIKKRVAVAVAVGKDVAHTNAPSAKFWGLITVSVGVKNIYVPVGLTPKGNFVCLLEVEDEE
jgi:hypothetical protein